MLEAVKMQVMGRGNKGHLGTHGLGSFEVRTYLWGDVQIRVSVTQRRTWMSVSCPTSLCSWSLAEAALPGGDTPSA